MLLLSSVLCVDSVGSGGEFLCSGHPDYVVIGLELGWPLCCFSFLCLTVILCGDKLSA